MSVMTGVKRKPCVLVCNDKCVSCAPSVFVLDHTGQAKSVHIDVNTPSCNVPYQTLLMKYEYKSDKQGTVRPRGYDHTHAHSCTLLHTPSHSLHHALNTFMHWFRWTVRLMKRARPANKNYLGLRIWEWVGWRSFLCFVIQILLHS